MTTLTTDPKTRHAELLSEADAIVSTAECQKRPLTPSETATVNSRLAEAEIEKNKIAAPTARTSAELRAQLGKLDSRLATPGQIKVESAERGERLAPTRYSRDYYNAFWNRAAGAGSGPINAALYEGASGSGGFIVPVTVDNFIAPLAPTSSDIRSIATVIETTKNLLLPTTAPTGLPSTTQTAELAAFAQSVPTLGQTEVQAFLNALLAPVSFELAQDVPGLEAYMRTVVEAALLEQEDALFVGGSGANEPQGLIGNVGAGIVAEPDGGSNLVSYAGLSALMGAVKAKYLAGSSWLMSQSTAIVVRAALAYSGATFEWTRDASGEKLFGYPVKYSASMPTAARGNAPVLFGNFRMGFVVADRGGPAVRLKILDQMFGVNGTLYWLLSRRTDSRVWVAESIQQYNVAAS